MEIRSRIMESGVAPDFELKLHYGGLPYLGIQAKSERLARYFEENAPFLVELDGSRSKDKKFIEKMPVVGPCYGMPANLGDKFISSHGVFLGKQRGEGLYFEDQLNLGWLRSVDLGKGISLNFKGMFTEETLEDFKETLSKFLKDFHRNYLTTTKVELDFYFIERGV